jgi:transcriptional regulator with XRE-family HTH domain
MSKAELARACKVSSPTVTEWESGGIKELTASKALTICEELDVDPWWLVFGKDSRKPAITRVKAPLSHEASKLILWIERLDRLGGQAPKLFGHIYQLMQVAGSFRQAQNPPVDADLANAESELATHIAHAEGKERGAIKKSKP